jgi:hypothetical protein
MHLRFFCGRGQTLVSEAPSTSSPHWDVFYLLPTYLAGELCQFHGVIGFLA